MIRMVIMRTESEVIVSLSSLYILLAWQVMTGMPGRSLATTLPSAAANSLNSQIPTPVTLIHKENII